MNKKILIIVCVIAAGVMIWQFWPQNQPLSEENQASNTVQEIKQGIIAGYSFKGEVLELKQGSVRVRMNILENGERVPHEILVGLNPSGEVYVVSVSATSKITRANPISELKVGDLVTVYGKGNPYTSDFIMSNRIEILR